MDPELPARHPVCTEANSQWNSANLFGEPDAFGPVQIMFNSKQSEVDFMLREQSHHPTPPHNLMIADYPSMFLSDSSGPYRTVKYSCMYHLK
jgi:hypothetical protein